MELNDRMLAVIAGAVSGFVGAIAPIIIARFQARDAARQVKTKLEATADVTRRKIRRQTRRDAINEWQKLYGVKTQEVESLRVEVSSLAAQNLGQQKQIDAINESHDSCKSRCEDLEKKLSQFLAQK